MAAPHLYQAAYLGLDLITRKLLEGGADTEAATARGYTAVAIADYACAKVLIEYGADINREWDMQGVTVSILEFQLVRNWDDHYETKEDPQGEAIKKLQLFIDNGLKFKKPSSFYFRLARINGNHKIANFLLTLQ